MGGVVVGIAMLLSILATRNRDKVIHVILGPKGMHHERTPIDIVVVAGVVFGIFGRVALI